jgi:hypothetical protein
LEDLDIPTYHASGQRADALIEHAVDQLCGSPLYFMIEPSLWKSLARGRVIKTIMSPRYSRAAIFRDEYGFKDIMLVPDSDVNEGEAEVRRGLTESAVARLVFD